MNHHYAIVTNSGKLESLFSGDPKYFESMIGDHHLIELTTPLLLDEGSIFYFDFVKNAFERVDRIEGHTFDYHSKAWVDTRSLDEVKEKMWSFIKSERDQIELSGFEYKGNIYDSDQVSQGRIMGAAVAGIDQVWTLADNTTVELSASELQQLYAALQAHIASVHERGRIARQLINEAETKEEVEAIQL